MNTKFNTKYIRLWFSLAVLFVVGLSFVVSAQTSGAALPSNAPRVSGSFEPDSIGIGDRFTYSIVVEKDLVQTVIFPNFAAAGGQEFALIEDPAVDTLERDGRRLKIRKSYLLAAFQEGWHHIRPQVMYADKNIIDTIYAPDTLELMVNTFQIDSTSHGLFDIKPQKTLPFKLGEITGYIAWSIVGILLLLALLYAAKRILAHYGKSFDTIFKPAPPLPPHEEAFAALERLRVLNLCADGKHKLYYSTLTDILRTYIVRRFDVGAMEMTSDEIIESMRGVELQQKQSMDLAMILREADLVKFAKAMPESSEAE
ncbi:MAG: hypothetical protein IIU93_08445, partial [Alistipes sp.]|nr:hypothetical protein [Alistipes sp.]